jgi:dTDP-glucose 4,6-dehydratase
MNEIYNISSTFFLENIDLVKKVCDNMGMVFEDSIEFVEDRLGHDFKYAVNSNKLQNLGFAVENNFDRNLEETIEHLSEVYA